MNKVFFLGTPNKAFTPRPVQSLTPKLQESLEWRQSTASETSSVCFPRKSRLSSSYIGFAVRPKDDTNGNIHDDVFEGVNNYEDNNFRNIESTVRDPTETSFQNNSSFKVPTSSLAKRHSHDISTRSLSSCTPLGRQGQSVMTDDDTPLLYRTKEAIQKSYAARHLASMRDGSDSVDGSIMETPDKSAIGIKTSIDDVSRNDSMCSIEMNRNMDSPPPMDLCITNPKICLSMSPEQSDSSVQKKRRYDCVEKSPMMFRGSASNSTGLTSEFQRFQMNSDPPAKRMNTELISSPERSVLSFHNSLESKTPEHPDNSFARESIQMESPTTPPDLVPPIAFIHLSSSPLLGKPGKASQSKSGQRLNQSPISLDSSLNRTKDNYLDISGTQEIPSSPPGEDLRNDTESSLGSELNNMSSVFFPGNKMNVSFTESHMSSLDLSSNKLLSDSSRNVSKQLELNVKSSREEVLSSNDFGESVVDDKPDEECGGQDMEYTQESSGCVADEKQEIKPATSTPQMETSHEEDKENRNELYENQENKPATSTPQMGTPPLKNKETCQEHCIIPPRKPVNKLIKKVKYLVKREITTTLLVTPVLMYVIYHWPKFISVL